MAFLLFFEYSMMPDPLELSKEGNRVNRTFTRRMEFEVGVRPSTESSAPHLSNLLALVNRLSDAGFNTVVMGI